MKMMGRKEGMTQRFDAKGNVVACTILSVEPHAVVAIRTKEKEGYNALQLGYKKLLKEKNLSKPLKGHFGKNQIEPRANLAETKIDNIDTYAIGQEIDVSAFAEISHVDVTAFSKGKGFQGVVKRYGFAGGPAAHGSSFHRHGGSTGMRSTPGRTLPGQKKAGRMGHEKVTVQNVKVLSVDVEKALILVQGAIPGANGALVFFTPSKKKLVVKKGGKKKEGKS